MSIQIRFVVIGRSTLLNKICSFSLWRSALSIKQGEALQSINAINYNYELFIDMHKMFEPCNVSLPQKLLLLRL
jgi:flagellar biosynthesis protein FliP